MTPFDWQADADCVADLLPKSTGRGRMLQDAYNVGKSWRDICRTPSDRHGTAERVPFEYVGDDGLTAAYKAGVLGPDFIAPGVNREQAYACLDQRRSAVMA